MPNPAGMFDIPPEEFIKIQRKLSDEKTALGLLADVTPVVGETKSLYEAGKALQEDNYLGAAMGVVGAIPLLGKGAKVVKRGWSAFTKEAIEKATKEAGRKSRTLVTEINIDDFLNLARKGEDASKADSLKNVDVFDEIPYLRTEKDADGVLKVVGHEGRHRARRLKELGYETIPVRITDRDIRWDQQVDPKSFDYKKEWPTVIKSEDGDFIGEFPIKQGEAGVVKEPKSFNLSKVEVPKEEIVELKRDPDLFGEFDEDAYDKAMEFLKGL